MRTAMREASLDEKKQELKEKISARNERADRLVEKWSKVKGLPGTKLSEASTVDAHRARQTAIILENTQNHLRNLTETQISSTFTTTPENVIRVVRLGWPNSVRGEIFLEWAMETARDSIYYLSPVRAKTKRGGLTGDKVVESANGYRYPSEIEREELSTANNTLFIGATGGNVSLAPLRPFTVQVLVNEDVVATDDGSGNVVGPTLSAGTINYTNGAISVTFSSALDATDDVEVKYNFDSEVSTLYPEIGSIELQLKDYQFRARPWPLYVSWSKMTELVIGTTLDIDAEEALVRGAADELKKSLDFHALRTGYRASLKNAVASFDVTQAAGESEIDRAQAITRGIDAATNVMYNSILRGGVTKMYGGPSAVSYLKLHRRFDDSNKQPAVGAHREGSLDGIDIYKVPTGIVPDNEFVCVYRNDMIPEDVSIAFGSLIPLYRTDNLEFKEMYTETGLAFFGDHQVLQNRYLVRLRLENLTGIST